MMRVKDLRLLFVCAVISATTASSPTVNVCEHRRHTITCPRGKAIDIIRAVYGRSDRSTCPSRAIRTTSCSAGSSESKVKASCNGRSSCTLHASNIIFGDPCVGTYKYLTVQYRCIASSPTVNVCEHRRHTITCPRGKAIDIVRAVYGRSDRSTCPSKAIRTTSCAAGSSESKVKASCNGRSYCTLHASNSVFGDPCAGTYKYLTVQYRCIASSPTVNVCEHRRHTVTCPRGKAIDIVRAVYGRSDRSTCPSKAIRTTSCAAGSSESKVKASCNGRSSCTLHASNIIFGDPCVGTYKYLTVQYRCIASSPTVNVCEQKRHTITCPRGKAIDIIRAVYGRSDRSTCPSRATRTTSCAAGSSESKVKASCNGRSSCTLHASNSVFGDPCAGTYKYLTVQYRCIVCSTGSIPSFSKADSSALVDSPSTETHTCEDQTSTIGCPVGKGIQIVEAYYGRTSTTICPHRLDGNTNCRHDTLTTVRKICNGRAYCTLWASNSIYGDPCVGIYKYLFVRHNCI